MPNPVITGPAPDLVGFREAYPTARTFYAPAHLTNYRLGGQSGDFLAFAWHTPEEKAHDGIFVTPWWFQQDHKNPRQRGTTFMAVEGDGDLFQCVRFRDTAFAQGGRPTDPADAKGRTAPDWWDDSLRTFNNGVMSMEVEGYARSINETFIRGNPQWIWATRFAAWFSLEKNISVDREHHMGHSEFPNQTHWDPNFSTTTWIALMQDISMEMDKLDAEQTFPIADHYHKLWKRYKTSGPLV